MRSGPMSAFLWVARSVVHSAPEGETWLSTTSVLKFQEALK